MSLLEYELNLWQKGYKLIAGVDEVGRGCLAGPIVTAAVIWDPQYFFSDIKIASDNKDKVDNEDTKLSDANTTPEQQITTSLEKSSELIKWLDYIKDSKKLSLKRRTELAKLIKKHAICYTIISVDSKEIDKYGIGIINKLALERAVFKLKYKSDLLLVDHFKIFNEPEYMDQFEVRSITKGDASSFTIAAASIVAKDYRDTLMKDTYNQLYPTYGFDKHVGYGTKSHIEAIKNHGLTDIHRRSFHLKN